MLLWPKKGQEVRSERRAFRLRSIVQKAKADDNRKKVELMVMVKLRVQGPK